MNTEATSDLPPAPAPPLWASLGLDELQLAAVGARGYAHPTPVQARSIPVALTGRDLLVRSKTGTGKTAAFLIPSIQRAPVGADRPAILVLGPTRELALQIAEEAVALGGPKGLKVATLYGGVPIGGQQQDLRAGATVAVGTPGRVLDLLRRGDLKLDALTSVVLDEADEMLSMGFFEDVTAILDHVGASAQVLLFSATVEGKLKDLVGKYLKSPEEIFLSVDGDRASDTITHVLYETTMTLPKPRQLLHLIEVEAPKSAIVFCNTKADVDLVARFLDRQGLVAEPISSDLPQRQREKVMAKVKKGEVDFLVATDIAARGIDIQDLGHVINYSLPEDPAVYLHRTGRTGRIGKKGVAVSLMSGREVGCRKVLESEFGVKFELKVLPDQKEAERLWANRQLGQLQAALAGGLAFEGFLGLARVLRERGEGGDALIAAALRGFFRFQKMIDGRNAEEGTDAVDPAAPGEVPARQRGDQPGQWQGGERQGGNRGRSGGGHGRGGRRGGRGR